MKVVFVNPPRSKYDLAELSAPLGLLKLSAVSLAAGADVRIIDFNLLQHIDERFSGPRFYASALGYLLEEDAEIYGFTSMAVDSHISLRLAQLLKSQKPGAVTVFGGSHFSSIADELLEAYDWVDYVVKGEGERAFEQLLKQLLQGSRSWMSGRFHRGVLSSEPVDFPLTFPDYGLVQLTDYFRVNPRRVLDYEGGRGCRFKCAFCYSPGHYSKVRAFSVDKRIAELNQISQLKAEHVFFVEDNFLNDPRATVEFCRELEAARLGLTWSCYATLPQVDTKVLRSMSRAGCRSIFMGIDAVGPSSEKYYKKNFLHRRSLTEVITECLETGIRPTCAFLLSPPSHRCGSDLERTLSCALAAKNAGADIRLNTLTLYNGTRSQLDQPCRIAADNHKVNLLLDLPVDLEENEYAKERPWLFPFHSRYVPQGEWSLFLEMTHCLFTLFYCYPSTLENTWSESNISPTEIAGAVLREIGNLVRVDKRHRRSAEANAFQTVMKKLSRAIVREGVLEHKDVSLALT